jgi:hypothetical protein
MIRTTLIEVAFSGFRRKRIVMIGLFALTVFFAAAALPYAILEKRWRWRWQEVQTGEVPAHAGTALYRQAGQVATYLREAPPRMRFAAFSCLLFGQLLLPGMVLATLGMFFFGLGMVIVPILITAGKLYRAGLLLLRREPRSAYFAARNAAYWSLWCAGFGVLGCGLTCYYAFSWLFVAIAAPVAAMIIGQALLLLHVTRRSEDALFATSRMVRLGDHWVSTDAA